MIRGPEVPLRMKPGPIALLFSLALAAAAQAQAPGVFAITNGTVHPVSAAPIARGVVLIRDGLIEAVGANVPIPADATVVDAGGAHVYPGLIDAHTSLGFAAAPAAEERRGSRASTPGAGAARPAEPTAAFLAAEHLTLSDADLDARRITGVTTVVTAPAAGIFAGRSAVLNLNAGPEPSRILRSPAAVNVAFRTRPTWTYPDSLMGVISHVRQSFYDAQNHAAARDAYEKNPAQRRPVADRALDALVPVIRRELPAVFLADSEEMIRRAQAIAREFNLRMVVAGAQQAWRMPEALRDVPVLVAVNWPVAPSDREEREEQPLRVIRARVNAPTTPAVLARSGVQFALVTGAGRATDFLPGIRRAIEEGLSAADALRAVTLTPATIFGVDRQLGSLERGKIANVVVADRPIFERNARVTRLFVDGREVRPQPAAETTRETSPVNGTWNLTVRLPEGSVSIVVTLRVESGHVSGTYSGDRGSGDISGGTYERPALQFTIAARTDAETHDWVFRGTVDDDSIEGTVSTNLGTFEFSGRKSP